MTRLFFYLLFFGNILNNYSVAQNSISCEKVSGQIDSIMSSFNDPNIPATEVAIIKNGKIIYNKGFGSADIEKKVPSTLETNFNIASNSKQFVAMCILLLEEKGKLNRTDDIRKYIPEMPVYEKTITINNLIYHTSGIRDYLELQGLMCKQGDFNQRSNLKLIVKQQHLNFEPGEYHLYSNSNYFLLGLIVERVSGYTLHKFIRDNIFTPLGMTNTFFSEEKTITNEAKDYRKNNNTYILEKNKHPTISGEGGIISNVNDLILWDQNFYHNILGNKKQKLIDDILITGKLNSFDNTYYAGALFNIQYKGKQAILHGGGFHSYSTQILRLPEDSLTIIFLCGMQISPDFYCFKIVDLLLKNKPPNSKTTPQYDITSQNISGYYINEKLLNYRFVEQTDSCIIINRKKYYKVAENNYVSDEDVWGWKNYLSFKNSGNDDIEMNHRITYTNDQYKKLKEDTLAPNVSGKYYCPELSNLSFELRFENKMPVFLVDGKYSAGVTKTFGNIGLIPTFSAVIRFETNIQKEVTGFVLSTDRVKNLYFVKK
jgi:CubicO group peptidase (beta-lactamase class C family)